jgi:hypothetical protein
MLVLFYVKNSKYTNFIAISKAYPRKLVVSTVFRTLIDSPEESLYKVIPFERVGEGK